MTFLLVSLAVPDLTPASAATIAYTVTGSTNDFQGTIDVTTLSASIAARRRQRAAR